MLACSLVAGVVGAVQGEVAQRLELGLDPVQPRGVGRGVGELDVVGGRPLGHSRVIAGRQVGAEVVQHDAQPYPGWVQGSQIPQEDQELAAPLTGLDVAVQPVAAQVVGGQQVPDPVGRV